ncbi:response regulator transcription factor [Clostridium beijerinckii]|uniref:Stage 0 sporulation protein A homolog n=1 Tax=Clostridium beijerinckii TaxID=1520 RepID=A0AAX0BCV1_CLOBE|nr:response regulator [Clostridium beijerinckii]NRT92319.1 YesN/AraC family two-component response regulator [Clostridium beijerinckii]NYC75538.1 YesN/AraC family two-component response regulator [Clostridium beijerinckii]
MDNIIKVMIIDDEHLIRDLIKNCIDWNEIGMEIVAEASNAVEGLNLINKEKPDIILTDINMPVTDGLDMSKSILEMYPDIKVIVITGYNEFEYAKRSIKIGVNDFILKPIDEDELRNSVLKLKDEIQDEYLKKKEYKDIKEKMVVYNNIINLNDSNETEGKNLSIEQIKKFIVKNISNRDLSLKLVAEYFYVNPSYLSRIFKEKTDETFSEYIVNTKVKIVTEMLKNPNAKAYEISKKIGIDDPNYFSNWFKKCTGLSIKEYKKQKS